MRLWSFLPNMMTKVLISHRYELEMVFLVILMTFELALTDYEIACVPDMTQVDVQVYCDGDGTSQIETSALYGGKITVVS